MKGGRAGEAVLKGKSEGETPQDTFDPAVGFGGGVRSLVIWRREVLREAWHLQHFLFFLAFREGSFVCVEKGVRFVFYAFHILYPERRSFRFLCKGRCGIYTWKVMRCLCLSYLCVRRAICVQYIEMCIFSAWREIHFLCMERGPFSMNGKVTFMLREGWVSFEWRDAYHICAEFHFLCMKKCA